MEREIKILPNGLKGKLFRLRLRYASSKQRAQLMKPYFHHVGENVTLCTTWFLSEPYLISIGNNVTVAGDVSFITHDASFWNMARKYDIPYNEVDNVGKIELKDNCFIGARTILMPNCSVGKNSIVAAGSIVTKHIPDNEVWGGVIAKRIMSIDEFMEKLRHKAIDYPWIPMDGLTEKEIIKKRIDFFWR